MNNDLKTILVTVSLVLAIVVGCVAAFAGANNGIPSPPSVPSVPAIPTMPAFPHISPFPKPTCTSTPTPQPSPTATPDPSITPTPAPDPSITPTPAPGPTVTATPTTVPSPTPAAGPTTGPAAPEVTETPSTKNTSIGDIAVSSQNTTSCGGAISTPTPTPAPTVMPIAGKTETRPGEPWWLLLAILLIGAFTVAVSVRATKNNR